MTDLPLTEGASPASARGDLRLDLARVEDAAAIARIHVAAWQAAYADIFSPEYLAALSVPQRQLLWREVITYGEPEVVVAAESGKVIGFAAFGASRDEDAARSSGEVLAIYVSPSRWCMGIGRRLWRHARERLIEQDYRTVSLWVLAKNARALRFCASAGFTLDTAAGKEIVADGSTLQELRYMKKLRE